MVAEMVRHNRHEVEAFGPGDILWETAGDLRTYFASVSAFTMQGLHPVIAAGVAQHSTVFTDPYGRGIRSFQAVMRWVYGGQDVAEAERQWLIDMHKSVKGVGYDGQHYSALTPEPFAWVWATAYPSMVAGLQMFYRGEVTPAVERRLYEEAKQLARILGVHERCIPPTVEEFWAYYDDAVANTLAPTPFVEESRRIARRGLVPPPPGTPRVLHPAWRVFARATAPAALRTVDFVSGAFMPPRGREIQGITWTAREEAALRVLAFMLRNAVPLLPERVRFHPYAYRARRSAMSSARTRGLKGDRATAA